jgi:hypothetical protein
MIRGFYEINEVADAAGLSPEYVRNISSRGMSTLVRGPDFFTYRWRCFNYVRARVLFTKRGLLRVVTRDFKKVSPRPTPKIDFAQRWVDERLASNLGAQASRDSQDRHRRWHDAELAVRLNRSSPCMVPGCACVYHRLVDESKQLRATNPATEKYLARRRLSGLKAV